MSKWRLAFHNKSLTQTRTERPALCPSSLWPHARPAPERARGGNVRVDVCVRVGANIPLAGSPGPGGEQGSAGEGEAACPAVN